MDHTSGTEQRSAADTCPQVAAIGTSMDQARRPSAAQRREKNLEMSKASPDTASLDSEDSHNAEIIGLHQTSRDGDILSSTPSEICKEDLELPETAADGGELAKSRTLLSKITTVKIDDNKLVPINERRGLFARFCLIPEYTDARELPSSLRRLIVFIIAFCAMLGPMGTSILLPASDAAVKDLGTTITILNVAIGVYLITLGVIPLWWSNFSERHGRRTVYIVSFIMYLCFTIGCALAKDVNTLIGFRVLSGGCAASVQSVGAGTIGDLYPITKRGAAMGLFYLGPLAGPLLSPIIGGAITSNKKLGWRATQWFLIILSGVCVLMITFLLPETLRRQDNREAIRKILRERRRAAIPKNDEENATTKASSDSNKESEKVNGSGDQVLQPIPQLNVDLATTPISPTTSIDSNVFDEESIDDQVDEEEVEHLNKLLTRMSTRRSVVGVTNSKNEISRSRKSSFISNKSFPRRLSNATKESGDYSANHLIDADEYESDNEPPIMDSVVPLSKIQTSKSLKRERTRQQEEQNMAQVAAELDDLHSIAHGSKFRLVCHFLKIYLYSPLKGFVFMRYPPVILSVAYSAPCFAALYVQNMTLTYKYSREPYNFSPILVGLMYVPNSVTYFIASIWGGRFNDYLLKKKIEKYGIVAPEARFGINVYVAAAILPLSMLITGWCLEYNEQWVTPLIGTALFGFAQMIVIGVTVTYLADCLPGRGATGIALNNFIRMIMAAGVSFVTEPLIRAIGTGVLFSICAGITAVLSILIVIIIRYGDHWRETYDLEKLYDIVDG